jgi:phage-related protein
VDRVVSRNVAVRLRWRIMYHIAADAIVILDVLKKQTEATPEAVLTACKRRLGEFQRLPATRKGAGHAKR